MKGGYHILMMVGYALLGRYGYTLTGLEYTLSGYHQPFRFIIALIRLHSETSTVMHDTPCER